MSSLVGVLLVLTTVWMSHDFGTLLLFSLGLSVSLRSYFDLAPRELTVRHAREPRALSRPVVRPRLAPGHPSATLDSPAGSSPAYGGLISDVL
jgi:hypothetical protein